jgi:hypothetical protein
VSLATGADSEHVLAPTLDHVVPRKEGGSDDPDNLQAAHRRCNSAKGASPGYDPSSPASSFSWDLRAILAERSPAIARLLEEAPSPPDPIEVPIPDLAPDEVADLYDSAIAHASAYSEGIAASPELVEIVTERLEDLGDAEEVEVSVTGELLEIAENRLAKTLTEQLPSVLGLAPVWGLRPFHEHDWPLFAGTFLTYADAWDTINTAVEDALIDTGEEFEYVLDLRSGRKEREAAARYKEGDLSGAERCWLEAVEIQQRLTASGYYGKRSAPPATPYRRLAVIRRRRGDASGEAEILARFAASVTSSKGLAQDAKDLLRRKARI